MDAPHRAARGVGAGLLLGLVSAAVAVGGMMAFGLATNQPTVGEVLAEGIAGVTPIEIIELMITSFGTGAKHGLFAATLFGMVSAGALMGALATRRGWRADQVGAAVLGAATLLAVVVLPLVGAGVLGANTYGGVRAIGVSLALTSVLFFVVFLALSAGAGAAAGSGPEESRRSFLRSTALGFGAVTVASSGLLRWLGGNLGGSGTAHAAGSTSSLVAPAVQEDPLLQAIASGVPGLSPEITPNDKFYTVSKNVFRDPSVNERDWRLDVGGLVQRPFALTYEELLGMPSSTQYFTLQCISNDIGGDLIGNALWRGVSLGDLLRRAGVRDGAVDVVLRSADDYHDSIPIAKAWQSDAMVAYEMNGVRLPQNHGFPARLLVPDIYGMKNVKWLTKIEVVDYDYQGYWMVRGWSDVATMNTTSRIDVPKSGSSLRSGRNYVGGVAVAGQRGIQAVEVSTDGGATWAPAAVKPGLGPNAWVLWLYEWSLPEPGAETRVLVRATDGNGMLQDGTVRGSLPDGATGYHTITIRRG